MQSFHEIYGETRDRISLGINFTQKFIVTEYAEKDSRYLVSLVRPSSGSVEEEKITNLLVSEIIRT